MQRFYAEEFNLGSSSYVSIFHLTPGNHFSLAHCDLSFIGKEILLEWKTDNWDAIVYRVDRLLSRKRVEVTNLVHCQQLVFNKNICVVLLKQDDP